jgi:serine/threonine-protein kinase
VAIKVLPALLSHDPERLARFEREAKLLASLNHPNIAAIYGLEEVDGIRFLALELVEGKTLGERIAKGPLPVGEALEVCRQIAEGVEAAHGKGVIHRDLKPANIMLTPQGHVKVMDFGLAKQVRPVEGQGQEITALTNRGSTLGTVPYMSPEQVRGQEVDARSDIFSFGVVLYEMLTGVNPFKGDTSVDTAHAILGETPPRLTRYTENIPVLLQHTVRKMLAKEPDDRYQLIHEVRTDLAVLIHEVKEALAGAATVSPTGQTLAEQPGRWGRTITLGLAVLAVAALGVAIWSLMRSPFLPPAPLRRLVIQLPSTAPLEVEAGHPAVALSPDGTRLVYVANRGGKRQLYLRRMDQLEATAITGTEGGYGPFFSPDGQSVGFAVGTKLKKVPISGGATQILGLVPPITRGASWGADNTIMYTADPNQGLSRIPAVGNTLPDDAFSDAPNPFPTHRTCRWWVKF